MGATTSSSFNSPSAASFLSQQQNTTTGSNLGMTGGLSGNMPGPGIMSPQNMYQNYSNPVFSPPVEIFDNKQYIAPGSNRPGFNVIDPTTAYDPSGMAYDAGTPQNMYQPQFNQPGQNPLQGTAPGGLPPWVTFSSPVDMGPAPALIDDYQGPPLPSMLPDQNLGRMSPEIMPVAQPAPRPVARPVAQPAPRPVARPVAQPAPRPVARPVAQPARPPVRRPAVQPPMLPSRPQPRRR